MKKRNRHKSNFINVGVAMSVRISVRVRIFKFEDKSELSTVQLFTEKSREVP